MRKNLHDTGAEVGKEEDKRKPKSHGNGSRGKLKS
jgi:hypothetical protein